MIKYINEIGDFWQFLADYWVLTDWPVFRMKVILMKNPTFFHALMARGGEISPSQNCNNWLGAADDQVSKSANWSLAADQFVLKVRFGAAADETVSYSLHTCQKSALLFTR
jgi:hypothetical protein